MLLLILCLEIMAEGRSNQELRAGEALCRVAQLDSKDTLDFKCEVGFELMNSFFMQRRNSWWLYVRQLRMAYHPTTEKDPSTRTDRSSVQTS